MSRVPVHGPAGMGSRQRKSPIGGFAYGMPLNTAPPLSSIVPRMRPPLTRTVGSDFGAHCAVVENAVSTKSVAASSVNVGQR